MNQKSTIVILVFIVLCMIVFAVLFDNFRDEFQLIRNINPAPFSELEAEEYYPDLSDTTAIANIEGNAEFKFPQSSRDIYAYTTGFRDIHVKTRFTIDTEDLRIFISSTRCNEPLKSSEVPPENSSPKSNWWKLTEAEVLMKCSGSTGNFVQIIYVDMTNPDEYVVYVEGSTH